MIQFNSIEMEIDSEERKKIEEEKKSQIKWLHASQIKQSY